MITIVQIKAARALLGWTQNDLASESGLSLPAINNIERSLVSPRKETLLSIENALSRGGVDFIEQSGVQLRPQELTVQILDGTDWLKNYDEVVMSEMKNSDDEIVKFSCDEEMWIIYGSTTNPLYFAHRDKIGFKERTLIPKSQKHVTNLRHVYRCHKDDLFREISWQVFGPYVSKIMWMQRQVLLIKSISLADAQRAVFEELWAGATPLSNSQWEKMAKWNSPAETQAI